MEAKEKLKILDGLYDRVIELRDKLPLTSIMAVLKSVNKYETALDEHIFELYNILGEGEK